LLVSTALDRIWDSSGIDNWGCRHEDGLKVMKGSRCEFDLFTLIFKQKEALL